MMSIQRRKTATQATRTKLAFIFRNGTATRSRTLRQRGRPKMSPTTTNGRVPKGAKDRATRARSSRLGQWKRRKFAMASWRRKHHRQQRRWQPGRRRPRFHHISTRFFSQSRTSCTALPPEGALTQAYSKQAMPPKFNKNSTQFNQNSTFRTSTGKKFSCFSTIEEEGP